MNNVKYVGVKEKMAKQSKEFQWRMEGMNYALGIAKKEGVEALERDIKRRGFLKAPMNFSQNDVDELCKNLYSTTMSVWGMVLNSTFGFGKKRLARLREDFERATKDVMDFDYLGNHYVSLEDYANYLNEKYDFGIDADRVATCQDTSTTDKKQKHMAHISVVLKTLREGGFEEAAVFLEKKI